MRAAIGRAMIVGRTTISFDRTGAEPDASVEASRLTKSENRSSMIAPSRASRETIGAETRPRMTRQSGDPRSPHDQRAGEIDLGVNEDEGCREADQQRGADLQHQVDRSLRRLAASRHR